MEWVWVFGIGFVVGSIAKLIKRELDPGGFFMPMLIGMGGAGLAAMVGQAMGFYYVGSLPSYAGALVGAVALVAILRPTRG